MALFLVTMKKTMKKPRAIRRKLCFVAWCCVVVSLLFSVGEGLQLAPFTSPDADTNSSQFGVSSSSNIAFFAHGPIDVPTQFRKREKRDSNDLGLPPSAVGEEFLSPWISAAKFQKIDYCKVLSFAAPGRAPPQQSKT
jgi:hypothetical protein